jgi:hypothetical protein
MGFRGTNAGLDEGGLRTVSQPYSAIIDNFEDGDLSEYGPDTGSYSVVSSPVFLGSNALGALATGRDVVASTSGLDNYPSPGDTIRVHVYPENLDYSQFLWGLSSVTGENGLNCYGVRLVSGPSIEIRKWNNGNEGGIGSAATTLPNGNQAWYSLVINWNSDGTITVDHRVPGGSTLATAQASDTDYTGSGIGIRGDGGTYYWDLFQIL